MEDLKPRFPHFGVNKNQQILRLLYEISKREDVKRSDILKGRHFQDFHGLKNYLLKRRFPEASISEPVLKPYLPKIEFKPSEKAVLKKNKFYPKNIFIEKDASAGFLAARFKALFPKAKFQEIYSLKEYIRNRSGFKIDDYNRRRDTVFITEERHDFFKKCPCTKSAAGCNYNIFNLGFGCIYDCTYCFLQGYTNSAGIVLPSNLDAFFDKFRAYKKSGMRIGTGEFSDSLALDKITCYSPRIIEFFRKHKDVTFEFKTKSVEVGNLLQANHAGNIVASWSLNPQRIIDENEYFTPSLDARLSAASSCAAAGYKVGFHFDPVIYYNGWQKDYKAVIENLFEKIRPEAIAWISLGTFRFPPHLKQIIERRFPQNKILDEELLLGYDNKLRYPQNMRYSIYSKMFAMLGRYYKKGNIYLCMEQRLKP